MKQGGGGLARRGSALTFLFNIMDWLLLKAEYARFDHAMGFLKWHILVKALFIPPAIVGKNEVLTNGESIEWRTVEGVREHVSAL